MKDITMELGLRATGREVKVLKFIYRHDDDEVRFYDIAEEINFGDERSNAGLEIVLEDLVDAEILRESYDGFHNHYSITDKGNRLINKLKSWDRQRVA